MRRRACRRIASPTLLGVVAMLVPLLAGCAGYRFGNATLFPPNIRTVYVPMFESNSLRPGLGEQLTEAVAKEIESRTNYKVVSTPNADSIMTGRIIADSKHLLLQNLQGDPRELQVGLVVEVTWVDRQGRAMREIPNVPLPAEIVSLSAVNAVVPEVGQSMATSQERAITKLARDIVSLMEVPW